MSVAATRGASETLKPTARIDSSRRLQLPCWSGTSRPGYLWELVDHLHVFGERHFWELERAALHDEVRVSEAV
jgi:hypothetical protein